MSTTNNSAPRRDGSFGYREALDEVLADLTATERRRVQAERAARLARYRRRSVLVDPRGLALA